MRSSELASILGFSSRYVSSYLSYWKVRGIVDYDSGYWYLTPKGEALAREVYERETRRGSDEYAVLARKILESNFNQAIKGKSVAQTRGEGGEPLPFIAELKDKSGSKLQERVSAGVCIVNKLKELIGEEELDILMTLITHYSRWGTTYMYLDQLQERLNADYTWLMKVLRELQSKGLIYIYTDPRLGVRVGFSKNLRYQLEICTSTSTTRG
jgi:Mn-dependent DtxR family transcriptional regulator